MLKIENLTKQYKLGKKTYVDALKGVSLEIKKGEVMALVGPSGSGKSTLLNIIGGLDREYGGEVHIEDRGEMRNLRQIDSNRYRRHIVQTIFQQFYLVPTLSLLENVTLPVKFGRQLSTNELRDHTNYILDKVGLSDRKNHKPSELSGGQIQRAAIARALITKPDIILADEPTGNLDTSTGDEIMELLFEINEDEGTTLVIITHDHEIIRDVKHQVFLRDGLIDKVSDSRKNKN